VVLLVSRYLWGLVGVFFGVFLGRGVSGLGRGVLGCVGFLGTFGWVGVVFGGTGANHPS